jgi:hypothetical protein
MRNAGAPIAPDYTHRPAQPQEFQGDPNPPPIFSQRGSTATLMTRAVLRKSLRAAKIFGVSSTKNILDGKYHILLLERMGAGVPPELTNRREIKQT